MSRMNFPAQVPNPAIRRLSLYLRQLEALKGDRVVMVSSREFAQLLGLTDAQVRKDLAYFGQFGRPGGSNKQKPCFLSARNLFRVCSKRKTGQNQGFIGFGRLFYQIRQMKSVKYGIFYCI